ncbi:MAG: transcriptional regulator GcvA [Motiliproteus sp.]|nr:transcriptional regulator GcvA [Motiliproteus sp.]MCW9052787.1 transcriptional regulator GcvA [Motiliproteus sp.]
MSRLPPLKALRAFEAAGRHESLKKAAEELHVTTGAISQQIKLLEEHLGVDLFRRLSKSVRLTEAGKASLPIIEEAFELLREGAATAQNYRSGSIISVSVAPSFGMKWLLPRLDQFCKDHPEIDLKVDASTREVDFAHEEVDLAIRYGPIKERGMHIEVLTEEEVFPVCSPRLLERPGQLPLKLTQPQQLVDFPLLHLERRRNDDHFPNWTQWLESAGVKGLDFQHGMSFSMSNMVLQAAIDGQGVAMGSSVLAADDLKAGRLIRPFQDSLTARYSYYLICSKNLSRQPEVIQFIEWIRSEIKH